MVDHLVEQWAVDPYRVALTGFSAGGFLSHRLACEAGFDIKAVATVGATVRVTTRDVCDPPGFSRGVPVSALVMVGDEDFVVPLQGRDDALSVEESAAMWRAIDGCSGVPNVAYWPGEGAHPRVVTEIWSSCRAGREVRSATLVGIGHTWPRPDTNPSSIDATAIVAEFVVRQW
jgi:polyhydroxybutyrate depolymerase